MFFGYYSNVDRGRCKKAQTGDQIPYILEPELNPKEFRKNWARLMQKIYEIDPIPCPKRRGFNACNVFLSLVLLCAKIGRRITLMTETTFERGSLSNKVQFIIHPPAQVIFFKDLGLGKIGLARLHF